MRLSEGSGRRHDALKNLAFEKSGHTGFQAELTKEQLDAIESVAGKVDKQDGKGLSSNDFTDTLKSKLEKAITNDEFSHITEQIDEKESLSNKVVAISENSTDEQYPSAKSVFKAIEACGDFELIDSATFTENVMQLTPTINGQYKELYLRFTVPTSGNASGIKARWGVQTRSDTNNLINKTIYNMGNVFVLDYSEEWYTAIHIKVLGKYVRTEVWFETSKMASGAYARGQNNSNYSGYVAPSVPTARGYIDALKISFASPSGTADENLRYLPAGTTYELWGVKA